MSDKKSHADKLKEQPAANLHEYLFVFRLFHLITSYFREKLPKRYGDR